MHTMVSVLTSGPVDSFFEVAKISYQTLVILTKVLRLQIFFFYIFNYVMYVMLYNFCMLCYECEGSQTTVYMKH